MVVNIGVNVNKVEDIKVNNNIKEEIKMVNIYEDGKIIGRVNSNRNLDYWDGNNFTHGGIGRHLGLTVRRNGDFVFIYTSQWQGDRDWAEVVSDDEALQAILRADAMDLLDNPRFKKLKALYLAEYTEADEVEDIEVNNNIKGEIEMKNINNDGVNIEKIPYTRVSKVKERKMKNSKKILEVVEFDEVENNEVNNTNNGEEMKMVNNNKEWIERIEVYVNVKNGRTLESLINDGTLADGSWQRLGYGPDENLEDVYVGDGWVVSIDRVNNLEIIGNPEIKHGTRVYVMNQGDIVEKALYLSVDEDGTVGREDVVYEMRSEEEVASAAVNKAGLFVRGCMSYFNVDLRGIDFEGLVEFYKQTMSGKNSYDTMYTESVEWLMYQIKNQRELEAHQDEDRIYDEDWGFEHLEDWYIEEVKVADDLSEDHDYYGTLYLSVDDYEMYKELDEAYGVLEDFKVNPAKYVIDDWYSSGDWAEEFNYWAKEVYNEFIDRFSDEDMTVMRRRLESGWYTDALIKIIRKLVAKNMYYYQSSYNEILETVEETESGIYLTVSYGGFSKTIKVDSINYTNHDVLCAVYELGYVIDVVY